MTNLSNDLNLIRKSLAMSNTSTPPPNKHQPQQLQQEVNNNNINNKNRNQGPLKVKNNIRPGKKAMCEELAKKATDISFVNVRLSKKKNVTSLFRRDTTWVEGKVIVVTACRFRDDDSEGYWSRT